MHRLTSNLPFFYGWAVLYAAGSSMVVRNAAGSLTLAIFIYPISQDLDWSRTLIAGAASVGGLASSFASPVVGWAVDRYGARLVLVLSIIVLGLSTISLAWATVPLAFYVAYGTGRVLFSSPIQIASSVVVSRWFVRRRGRATGMLFVSHSIGMVSFPLIAGFIIRSRGWEDAWVVLGIMVWAIALTPALIFIRQSPEDVGLRPDGDPVREPVEGSEPTDGEEPSWSLREAMRTRALWLLALATGSLFLLQSGTNIHQAAYFIDQGLGTGLAATSISVNAVFTGVGSIGWGWLVDRVPVRYTYAGVALIMALALALFPGASTAWEALFVAALFGLAVGGILVVPVVAYADYFGRQSLGAIRGVTEPFVSLGQAIGAVFSGLIYDLSGDYQNAFITLSALGFATICMILLTKRPVWAAVEEAVVL